MDVPSAVDHRYLASGLGELVMEIPPATAATTDPDAPEAVLPEAIGQLLDIVARIEADRTAGHEPDADDITELGEYGIRLLQELDEHLSGGEQHLKLMDLNVALGLWIARHGGQLLALEPLVDSLAHLANGIQTPDLLAELEMAMAEIQEAVSPALQQDLERDNPGRPWRLLLLNRAIVATRSHQPERMSEAFDNLVKHLPEEAPAFFGQGMEQMDRIGYPAEVRAVMEQYYNEWGRKRSLH